MSNRSTDETLHKLDALISRRQASGLAPSRRPVKIISPTIPVLTDTVENLPSPRATVVPLRQDDVISSAQLPNLLHEDAHEPTVALDEQLFDSVIDPEPEPTVTTTTLPEIEIPPTTPRPRQNLANRVPTPPPEHDLSEAAANLANALRQAGKPAPFVTREEPSFQETGLVEDFDFPDLTDDGLETATPSPLRNAPLVETVQRATPPAAPPPHTTAPPTQATVISTPPSPERLLDSVMAEILPLVDVEVEKHLRTCILPKLRDFYQQLLDDTVTHVQTTLEAHIEARLSAQLHEGTTTQN